MQNVRGGVLTVKHPKTFSEEIFTEITLIYICENTIQSKTKMNKGKIPLAGDMPPICQQ